MPKISILMLLLCLSIISYTQFNPTKIDIIRDKYGVPHIFGKTDPEVAYGLAWALWQVFRNNKSNNFMFSEPN